MYCISSKLKMANRMQTHRVPDNLMLAKIIGCLGISCILMSLVSAQDNFYMHGRFGKRKEPVSSKFSLYS